MIRSPRFIRPHQIIIKNKIGEKDGNAVYQETTIKYVCADTTYGIKQSQKGIQADGNTLVIIDMGDLVAFDGIQKRCYLDALGFEKAESTFDYFTLRVDDIIVFKDLKYTIVSISEISPTANEPNFIEVIANG